MFVYSKRLQRFCLAGAKDDVNDWILVCLTSMSPASSGGTLAVDVTDSPSMARMVVEKDAYIIRLTTGD
jgi:hypothetical protein